MKIVAFYDDGWLDPVTDFRQWDQMCRAYGVVLQMVNNVADKLMWLGAFPEEAVQSVVSGGYSYSGGAIPAMPDAWAAVPEAVSELDAAQLLATVGVALEGGTDARRLLAAIALAVDDDSAVD